MAPYKLEDNIREKMEARELKPSDDAWKKLQSKLDAEQPKKRNHFWLYAAASFVGLLIAASIFFSKNTEEVNTQIVNENIEQPKVEKKTHIVPQSMDSSREVVSEENAPEKKSEKKQIQNSNKSKLPSQMQQPNGTKKSTVDKKIQNTDAIATQTETKTKQPIKAEKPILSDDDKIFSTKVAEVVASVKKLQERNTTITATEVEALLNNARRDIQTQRILNNPKVDAMALLEDVEWELEKSFRDKVFDALGEGFNKIRTAVSERNE